MVTFPPRQPGFYGKLPIQSDFVGRRLPRQFLDPWLEWLQGGLAASRERLAAEWLDIYLTSPIWRFGLSAGLCGDSAWAGIMMPSVDRVGRYFPLTLAIPIDDSGCLTTLFGQGIGWFEGLEALALSSLEDEFDADTIDEAVRGLELPPLIREQQESSQARDEIYDKFAIRIDMAGVEQTTYALNSLGGALLSRCFPTYSLWGTRGSERVGATLLACEGLPPIEGFVSLITGNWKQRGWDMKLGFLTWLKDVPSYSRQTVSEAVSTEPQPAANETQERAWNWRSFGISHIGNRRKTNQDAWLERPELGLWAVADGMGGHGNGDRASQMLVEILDEIEDSEDLQALIDQVTTCVRVTNQRLQSLAEVEAGGKTMGSTLVALLAKRNACAVLWAGDSRLYRYRDGKLEQMTRDHLASDAWGLPESGGDVITRAVGAEPNVDMDILRFEAVEGDVYLLSSDGLTKELNFGEIAHHLSSESCKNSALGLMNATLENEGRDNVTVIVVRPEVSPKPETSPAWYGNRSNKN